MTTDWPTVEDYFGAPDTVADHPPPDDPPEQDPRADPVYRFTPGGSFILDTDPEPKALWGTGEQVLWADGEAVIIAGAQGLGKTTLAQQLALGRCGFTEYADLLGFPIMPGRRRVLYLAMDRPKQAARSFRRMVGVAWRAELDARLIVWQGPPPYDMARHPAILTRLCEQADADTAILDSLKDAAIGLTDDEVGAGYNRARQHATVNGVQLAELHHIRKAPNGKQAGTVELDDLYGSTWLPSGAGSVILLAGKSGDPIVGFHHLKQPSAEVGPFRVFHNWDGGRSAVSHEVDLVLLAGRPDGLTAVDAARAMFDTDKPTTAEKEKARRRLAGLETAGSLVLLDPGDKATNSPARWGPK
jgi:hypothetical protein